MKDGGADDAAAGTFGHPGETNGIVVERRSHGGASAELPQATVEPGCTTKLAVAIFARDAALLDFGDEDVAGVD